MESEYLILAINVRSSRTPSCMWMAADRIEYVADINRAGRFGAADVNAASTFLDNGLSTVAVDLTDVLAAAVPMSAVDLDAPADSLAVPLDSPLRARILARRNQIMADMR